jgi:DNA-3-methyladenine glycosylase II
MAGPSGPLSPAEYEKARRHLVRRDPALGAVIKRLGRCRMADRQRSDHLTALLGSIVSQQLSGKAASTIFGRFQALFAGGAVPGAAAVLKVPEARLRSIGLSRQKASYVLDLCTRIVDGRLQLADLDTLDDEAVVERLTAVKGFGRWTAEMFLMFRLHRPDVMPVADLGIANAVHRIYGLKRRPDAARIARVGEVWRPYRSVA